MLQLHLSFTTLEQLTRLYGSFSVKIFMNEFTAKYASLQEFFRKLRIKREFRILNHIFEQLGVEREVFYLLQYFKGSKGAQIDVWVTF